MKFAACALRPGRKFLSPLRLSTQWLLSTQSAWKWNCEQTVVVALNLSKVSGAGIARYKWDRGRRHFRTAGSECYRLCDLHARYGRSGQQLEYWRAAFQGILSRGNH